MYGASTILFFTFSFWLYLYINKLSSKTPKGLQLVYDMGKGDPLLWKLHAQCALLPFCFKLFTLDNNILCSIYHLKK